MIKTRNTEGYPLVSEWSTLTLRGYSSLTARWFNGVYFDNLAALEITQCDQITGEVFSTISEICPNLIALTANFLPEVRVICKRRFGQRTNFPIEFKQLQRLTLDGNVNLESVILETPELRHLVINNSDKLGSIRFSSSDPNKKIVLNIREISLTNNRSLTADCVRELISQQNKWPRTISLEGCSAIPASWKEFIHDHSDEFSTFGGSVREILSLLAYSPPIQTAIISMSETQKNYLRFLRGVLIYRPTTGRDVGKRELPISDFLTRGQNPLESTFDLSGCGDAGKYLSMSSRRPNTRKQKRTETVSQF